MSPSITQVLRDDYQGMLSTEQASWPRDLRGPTGLCLKKGPALGLILCCRNVKYFNNVLKESPISVGNQAPQMGN